MCNVNKIQESHDNVKVQNYWPDRKWLLQTRAYREGFQLLRRIAFTQAVRFGSLSGILKKRIPESLWNLFVQLITQQLTGIIIKNVHKRQNALNRESQVARFLPTKTHNKDTWQCLWRHTKHRYLYKIINSMVPLFTREGCYHLYLLMSMQYRITLYLLINEAILTCGKFWFTRYMYFTPSLSVNH